MRDSGSLVKQYNDENCVLSIESDGFGSEDVVESRTMSSANQSNSIPLIFGSNDSSRAMVNNDIEGVGNGSASHKIKYSPVRVIPCSMTLPDSQFHHFSHPLRKLLSIGGQTLPSHDAPLTRERGECDSLEVPFFNHTPSEESRENDSILTLNPPSSEGQDGESLIIDTTIANVQSDDCPNMQALDEMVIATLRVRRCYIWTLLILLILGILITLSIVLISHLTRSTSDVSNDVSCSINDILKGCHENMEYQVKIPSCLIIQYQALRQEFRNKLDLNLPIENSCSAENLALLSVAKSTTDITVNTTIIQRYGLALLYFSTIGTLWNDQHDWLSDASHCQWASSQIGCSSGGTVIQISLGSNNLQGYLPSNLLTFLPELKYFNAEANSLIGSIPSDLSRLSVLMLDNNALYGAIPRSIVESDTIEILSISKNNALVINRDYPFFNGSQWRYLSLGRVANIPTGSIPSEISKLSNLRHLDFSFSLMTGTLPTELGLLQTLTSLDVSGNSLKGTIPTELGNMMELNSLTLYMNMLSGTIPSEIGKLKQVSYIFLDNNSLCGVIPSEICLLVNLVLLSLSNNNITGDFPRDIWRIDNSGSDQICA
jgi:hypothetical protein